MSAEQTPDIETLCERAWDALDMAHDQARHVHAAECCWSFPGVLEALAPVLAAAVREAEQRALRERVEALRPAAWTIPSDLCGGEVGEWIEVIRLDRLREALDAADGHRCSTCVDCLHDGHKCCGCYDGACCQTGDVRADRVAEPQHEVATSGNAAERGRQLANEREELIARGIDPSTLAVPIHPDDADNQGDDQ